MNNKSLPTWTCWVSRKKIIGVCCLLAAFQAWGQSFVPGDIAPRGTPDGQINAADIALLEKFVLGLATPTAEEYTRANVAPLRNPDSGPLNGADLALLRRGVLGLADLDFVPPDPVRLNQTNIEFSPATGTIRLNGASGSVEPNAVVTVRNTRTGEPVQRRVGNGGDFSATINAAEGDAIEITVSDASGNQSVARTLTVLADPSMDGPYPVANVEYDDANGFPNLTASNGISYPLAWLSISYPATTNVTDAPVNPGQATYPLVLMQHFNVNVNCDNDGSGPGLSGTLTAACPSAQRIPWHRGFRYLMDRLASYGFIVASMSAHQALPLGAPYRNEVRNNLFPKTLEKLYEWHRDGIDPYGGIFAGKIDFSRIAMVGHSMGGGAAQSAAALVMESSSPPFYIRAIALLASDGDSANGSPASGVPHLHVVGTRDSDLLATPFRVYDATDPTGLAPKALVVLEGANHGFFNTVRTSAAELGEPNPWAGQQGADDQGPTIQIQTTKGMTAANQRAATLATIVPFLRWNLQEHIPSRQVFASQYRFMSAPVNSMFFSYRDSNRLVVDDFSDGNPGLNTLGGAANGGNFSEFVECTANCFSGINGGSSISSLPFPIQCGGQIEPGTNVMRLGWLTGAEYETVIPPAYRNVSAYSVLSFRVAQSVTAYPPLTNGQPLVLFVNLEDGHGIRSQLRVSSANYAVIPYPPDQIYTIAGTEYCEVNIVNRSIMNTLRIPLEDFQTTGLSVDLADIRKIILSTEGQGLIGIDNIGFSR